MLANGAICLLWKGISSVAALMSAAENRHVFSRLVDFLIARYKTCSAMTARGGKF